MEIINWLQEWCQNNCNCGSENIQHVRVFNIENPGWGVNVELKGTDVEKKVFEEIRYDNGDNDWVFCYIRDGAFQGWGDSHKLLVILDVFKCWVEKSTTRSEVEIVNIINKYYDDKNTNILEFKISDQINPINIIEWFQNWYQANCDGYWESMYGVSICATDEYGWTVDIELIDTDIEQKVFSKIENNNEDTDWLLCFVEDGIFHGKGDIHKLNKILGIFRKWVDN